MNTQRTVICEGHSIHHYILAKQKVWIGQDNLHQIRAIQIFPYQVEPPMWLVVTQLFNP
jgi:hypothetical protein